MRSISILFAIIFSLSLNAQSPLRVESGLFNYKYYEGNQRISKIDFQNKVNKYSESSLQYSKYKNKTATAFTLLGGAALFTTISVASDDDTARLVWAGTGLAFVVAAIFPTVGANKAMEKTVRSYNKATDNAYQYITPSSNGVGLVLHF